MGKKEESKKPQQGAASPSSPSGPQGAAANQPVVCTVPSCKEKPVRFGFCKVHHEQYEFGLIKGDGQPAADHEKKVVHFQDFLERKKKQKVPKAA